MKQNNQMNAALGFTAAILIYLKFMQKKSSKPTSNDTDNSVSHFLLAGDIGGTNSRMALYSTTCTDPLFVKYYANEVHLASGEKFEDAIILPFLTSCFGESFLSGKDPSKVSITACLACAGPVKDNHVNMTNIGKGVYVNGNHIEQSSESYLSCITRAKIVNDFVGMGYGALDLDLDKETVELTPGSKELIDPLGPKVCVGAGTGLGECFLTVSSLRPDAGYECYPSEGGHVEFAPRTEVEIGLLHHLKEKFAENHRVSVERVVSGKGLANVYQYLADTFPERVVNEVHAEFLEAGDMQGKVVSVNASPGSLCEDAMNIFASAYGSEVGSAGLKFIPTGGLYVVGGLTPKNLKHIQGENSPFMRAYQDKGRVSPLLKTVPLFAVLNEDLGLRGARVCAQRVSFVL